MNSTRTDIKAGHAYAVNQGGDDLAIVVLASVLRDPNGVPRTAKVWLATPDVHCDDAAILVDADALESTPVVRIGYPVAVDVNALGRDLGRAMSPAAATRCFTAGGTPLLPPFPLAGLGAHTAEAREYWRYAADFLDDLSTWQVGDPSMDSLGAYTGHSGPTESDGKLTTRQRIGAVAAGALAFPAIAGLLYIGSTIAGH